MSFSRFQVVETIGVVSVVISLLIVAYEIRQTNQIAIVTAEIELRNNFSGVNELMATNSALMTLVTKADDPSFQVSAAEYVQLRSFAFRFMNIWIASEIAFENDMLPESSFQIVLNDISRMKESPGMHRYFREILDNYPGWSETEVAKAVRKELGRGRSP